MELTREVVGRLVELKPREIGMREIADAVCETYNISIDSLMERNRQKEVAKARQICMYLAKKMTKLSNMEIGQFYNRTHATVIHAVDSLDDELQTNVQLGQELTRIQQSLIG